jgi:predicted ribosomally synthesized peptide with SipW-like signal peptide
MIFLTLLIASTLAAFTDVEYQNKFVAFMQEHKKSYSHEEFAVRFGKFRANVDFIEEHNKGTIYGSFEFVSFLNFLCNNTN